MYTIISDSLVFLSILLSVVLLVAFSKCSTSQSPCSGLNFYHCSKLFESSIKYVLSAYEVAAKHYDVKLDYAFLLLHSDFKRLFLKSCA